MDDAIKKIEEMNSDEAFLEKIRREERFEMDRMAELNASKKKALAEGMQQGLEQGMQQGLEQGMQQGLEQGLEQGKNLGSLEATKQIAKNMKNASMSIEDIMKLTGLSKEEILKL